MKITRTDGPPKEILTFDNLAVENELNLTPDQVEDVAEIFNTPLTGAYNWDYTVADNRIKKLYELGKELNWNGSIDLNWDYTHPADERLVEADEQLPHETLEAYENLSEEDKIEFDRHDTAELLSQFLHGEQGALLVASQLTSCAPTYNAKLYAASQTFDEARHVEVFNKYLQERIGWNYPVMPGLKALLDKILSDPRWDLKFIGMQIIIEGLALAAFERQRAAAMDPLLKDIFYLVIRDEARHVTFGVNYLEEFVATLSDKEREERADFAYEACVVMRNRFGSDNVMKHYGWNVEEAQEVLNQSENARLFNNLLFAKIMPNLKRIGLITEKTQEKYEEMDILQFQDLEDHGNIDWEELSQPLDYSSKTA